MNRKVVAGSGFAIALALFFAINIIANQSLTSTRLDLTENRLYTLSTGTTNILDQIEEPITLRFYYSANQFAGVPRLLNYGKRVRDMLEEYAVTASGKLKLTVIDPAPFSETEDQAVAAGVERLPLTATGQAGYLGIVGTNTTDDELVMPALSPDREDALEYEITKMIYNLARPQKRVIGLLSWLPVIAPPPNPAARGQREQDWAAFVLLREFYDIRELDIETDEIDEDIDTLIIIHPKDISRKTLYAIDQFVLRGGKALVFVDPMAEHDDAQPDPSRPGVMPAVNSDLGAVLAAWGLRMLPDKVVGDAEAAVRVSFRSERGPLEVDYLPWLRLQGEALNRDDFVTNELNVVNIGSAGALETIEGSTLEHTPMLQSGPRSGLIDRDAIIFVRNPTGLLENFEPTDTRYVIAMRVSGLGGTAFPDGRPLDDDEKMAPADDKFVAEASEPINVIVVADTDVLADRFWVRFTSFANIRIPDAFGNNADFLVNAVDNLGGNDDLIGLRSRGNYTRPFHVVQEIQREAEAKFRDRERALQARLSETESKLAELQQQDGDGMMLLSPEQKTEIDKFRQEQVKTRKELRAVQHDLQRNIESLGTTLKFLNIALVPLVISVLAILISMYAGRTRRAA